MAKYTNELYHEDLTEKEIEDVAKIVNKTLSDLVKCADKHNIDRDSFVKYFADMLLVMCKVSTFRNFNKEKDNGN